ncbi:MAG: hypothetical protein CL736_02410 [Chloroflexi bacterium]|nr:hypothetical protein [Chloroflexota bacterium]|tara:strand:+ start:1489 stop:4221 length:2733 start_codon:yes stop_codon:yes gene_type:complete
MNLKQGLKYINSNYLIAVDIETTGLNTDTDNIIEIAAIKFLNGEYVDKYVTFVNPMMRITEEITALTGISDNDVLFSPTISQISEEINEFIGNAPVVGHNLKFDLSILNRENIAIDNDFIDTYDIAYLVLESDINLSLSSLADHLNVPFDDLHRAEGDAYLSFQVFQSMIPYIEKISIQNLSLYSFLASKVDKQTNTIWEILATNIKADSFNLDSYITNLDKFSQLNYDEFDKTELRNFLSKFTCDEFITYMFSHKGPIASTIKDFYQRASQLEMSSKTANTFELSNQILIEAGTGTGKTLAYLIPALWHSVMSDKKVAISTNTITLQDQLINKEIPALLNSLKEDVNQLEYTNFAHPQKGKNNYVCISRYIDILKSSNLTTDQYRLYSKVGVWIQKTSSGDKNEIHIPGWQNSNWDKISVGMKHNCNTRGIACFYDHSRKIANISTLLIVNHSLLLADLRSGNNILPEYGYLIIDEAHNLEQEIINQFGFEASKNRILDQLKYYQNSVFLRNRIEQTDKLENLRELLETHSFNISEFFTQIDQIFNNQVTQNNIQNLIVNEQIANSKPFISLLPIWNESLQSFKKILNLNESIPELQADEFSDFIFDLDLLYESIQELLINRNDNSVYWINKRNRYQSNEELSLKLAPLNTAEILENYLYVNEVGTLLTSATLSINGSLDYASTQYGIDNTNSSVIKSPFDYKNMVLLGLIRDIPDPRNELYQQKLDSTLVDICSSTKGGILILHTSYYSLRISRSMLKKSLETKGYTIKAQGIDGTINQILSSIQNHENFIIMGTNTLWEGIDIPDSKLKSVVITRLPFGVPGDPINTAKSAKLNNPFRELTLPQAIIRFRQGFGRLIRNEKGKGAVFILDSRIINQQYGNLFINSIPECSMKKIDTSQISILLKDWK